MTRRKMLKHPTQNSHVIFDLAREMFFALPEFLNIGIRLLGVSATNLEQESYSQINLFNAIED